MQAPARQRPSAGAGHAERCQTDAQAQRHCATRDAGPSGPCRSHHHACMHACTAVILARRAVRKATGNRSRGKRWETVGLDISMRITKRKKGEARCRSTTPPASRPPSCICTTPTSQKANAAPARPRVSHISAVKTGQRRDVYGTIRSVPVRFPGE